LSEPAPAAFALANEPVLDRTSYRAARLIGPPRSPSRMSLGVEWIEAGQTIRWSLGGPSDSEYPDFGQRDEIYYVVHGQVRISWPGGQILAAENTAIHLPEGLNYELLCERDAEILFVLTPPLAPPT
jgi:ethanolamine utilization protein EutQ (cupin superfamily)